MGLRRENYAACDGKGACACGGESSLPCWAGRSWVGVGGGGAAPPAPAVATDIENFASASERRDESGG